MPAFDSDNKTIGELRAIEEKVRLHRLSQEPEYIEALAKLTEAKERIAELEKEDKAQTFRVKILKMNVRSLEEREKYARRDWEREREKRKALQSRLDESNKGYRAMHADASGFEARIEELDDVGRRLDRAFVKKCKESEEQDAQITAAINTLRAGALPFFTDTDWVGISVRKALKQLGYEEDISQDPGAGEEGG